MHYGIIHSINSNLILSSSLPFINQDKLPKRFTLINEGDLILADTSEDRKDAAKGIEIINQSNAHILSGLHTIHLREKAPCTIPGFKTYYVASKSFRNFTRKYCEGIKVFSIKPSLLKYTHFAYPQNKNEQFMIVDFLNKIEDKKAILEKKIDILKKYKEGIMIKCYELAKNQVISLSKLVKNNIILLGRGEIIPKQNGTFPVYSSSAANNGLFCFRNKYSFDEELITWSIDGGGKPFLRNKHKFSITNVCGYAKILDLNIFSYSWLYINFWNSWRKIKFDYTTKAHPSVIEKLYKIKSLDIESQMKIEKILTYIDNKIDYLIKELNDVTLTKESLLRSLFF